MKVMLSPENCEDYFKHLARLISEVGKKTFPLHPDCIHMLLGVVEKTLNTLCGKLIQDIMNKVHDPSGAKKYFKVCIA